MNVTRTCLASPKLAIALALAASCASLPAAAQALTDAQLAQVVGQRLHGDRTGACMAATTGAATPLIGAGSSTATISSGTSAHSA